MNDDSPSRQVTRLPPEAEIWKRKIAGVLAEMMNAAGIDGTVDAALVVAEIPPDPAMGDLGFPMFGYAKLLRKGPPQIAQAAAALLRAEDGKDAADGADVRAPGCAALGPYVNVRLDRARAVRSLFATADVAGGPASGGPLSGRKIMVEFSSPNTNKPLHLGHLRNDVLGESVSRILAASGAEVRKVCIINDRGIHICKSMLAFLEHGGEKTPESEHVKSDHFVGDFYVLFNSMDKAEKKREGEMSEAEKRARELLRKWESGDPATTALWKKMNGWAVDGMKETWERTGISFDQFYYESQTYLLGKEEVLKGLERGIFRKEEDGAVTVDLGDEKLDTKVLLRSDGTSIYITQDIGTAIFRHRDWPFDRLVFVVGSEQQYHFKVLFAVLRRLGFDWARSLYHLSYGMVNLPEGKMKSREGVVVDADDLLDSLRDMALLEIQEKEREEAVGDPAGTAEKIALGALHYYLLQASPLKDMLFNPKESLSFNGNTGPYLQYMGARISSMLKKAAGSAAEKGKVKPELLAGDAEWDLVKTVTGYEGAVNAAAAAMDPSVLTAYLYELSRSFSRFYHDCPILNAPDADLAASRLALSREVLRVLKDALYLVCIPFLDVM
ncbi:MAG: arginine--tRNA ligase [Treponema sp.]|jgi:arginyl-tRNA synthetase|nr:arginine--tRNA ligase [Treponema sp.]